MVVANGSSDAHIFVVVGNGMQLGLASSGDVAADNSLCYLATVLMAQNMLPHLNNKFVILDLVRVYIRSTHDSSRGVDHCSTCEKGSCFALFICKYGRVD